MMISLGFVGGKGRKGNKGSRITILIASSTLEHFIDLNIVLLSPSNNVSGAVIQRIEHSLCKPLVVTC